MTKVECPVWRDEWIESGEPKREAIAHAASCTTCRRALADHESTWTLLAESASSPAPTERFRAAVWKKIDVAERADRVRRFRILAPLTTLGVAAAIALVFVLFGSGNAGDAPSAMPPPPEELLANLDLYENLDFIEESGEELDWIAALESELSFSDALTDGESGEE